jgi:hypothetical protein
MVRGVFTEPMFLMLLVAGGIYLLLGDRAEAALLLAFVFVVIGITLAQERKTQRALESLRDLSAPRALVIRDGAEQRIAGRDVVRGDLLVLHEGDRVAADALLVQGQLTVDESLLTGEAVPVDKLPAPEPDQPVPPATSGPLTVASPPDATAAGAPATPGGDGTPHLFCQHRGHQGCGAGAGQRHRHRHGRGPYRPGAGRHYGTLLGPAAGVTPPDRAAHRGRVVAGHRADPARLAVGRPFPAGQRAVGHCAGHGHPARGKFR